MSIEYYIVCSLWNQIYVRGAGNRSRSESSLSRIGEHIGLRAPLSGYRSHAAAFEAREKMLSAWPSAFVIEVDWDEDEIIGWEINEKGERTRGVIR